jgi:tannase/feruloyl esterase
MKLALMTALVATGTLATPVITGEVTVMVAQSCESLTSLTLPNTTITLSEAVGPGAFTPPASTGEEAASLATAESFRDLPAFCRVAATLKPSNDSDIKIEVWMPTSGWNGKFQAVGNGGWAGTLSYLVPGRSLASALRRGYATASTDTGHVGTSGDGSFALGHPEKLVDFAYRAVHEMTVHAKAIVNAYYGSAPRLSYWNGCSSGGRQGLKEAQRYPTDYDGIIAGAPGNYWTHMTTQSLWVAHATLKDSSSYIPPEKYAVIHKAVLDACDALDGVKDGILGDPTRCRFDPKVLQCSGADTPTCLAAPQVEAAQRIYGLTKNPRTGAEIFPGLEPGSEMEWAALAGGPAAFSAAADYFRYVVLKNPNWDYKSLDFDKDVAMADKTDNGAINATDPNLKAFFDRGGKILMYHGWADQLIPPRNSINYYSSVAKAFGGANKVADSIRLFMVPGMKHCVGGDGANSFDSLGALEQWVEHKKTPEQLLASHLTNGVADRTRPLCPYPQVAEYKGTGSTDEAANFKCQAR